MGRLLFLVALATGCGEAPATPAVGGPDLPRASIEFLGVKWSSPEPDLDGDGPAASWSYTNPKYPNVRVMQHWRDYEATDLHSCITQAKRDGDAEWVDHGVSVHYSEMGLIIRQECAGEGVVDSGSTLPMQDFWPQSCVYDE